MHQHPFSACIEFVEKKLLCIRDLHLPAFERGALSVHVKAVRTHKTPEGIRRDGTIIFLVEA